MPVKYVYIITSSPEDIYLEQTFLSIYSLRQHEPDAHIVLLTDNRTEATLTGVREKVLELVTERVVVDFDESVTNMRRSRFLKTSMRNLIDGDLLYIDGDTIVNAPLHEIESVNCEIGAVEDAHRPLDEHYGKEKLERQSQMLGFDFSGEKYYFNGGLMYVKDTPRAREFFKRWHVNWLESSRLGLNLDMPALIKTNIEMGHMIQRIDGSWNCQLMYGFNYYTTAKIIHYFASRYTTDSGGYLYRFMDPKVFEGLKKTFVVSPQLHEDVMHPLQQFSNGLELIGYTDVYILNTHVYKLVRLIYMKKPNIFNIIQKILFKINRIKKKHKE